jgi:hypothetical protein
METIIRWDRESDHALLYTADMREARRWRQLGYTPRVIGWVDGRPRTWEATVPVAAIGLFAVREDGTVRVPRWAEPPTISDRAEKARESREPEKTRKKTKEIRANFPDREQAPSVRGLAPCATGALAGPEDDASLSIRSRDADRAISQRRV